MFFSSIEEINRLTSKGMTFLKLRFSFLSEGKFEEMQLLWRRIRYKVYSGKRLFWRYRLQLSFIYKTDSQISFNLFCSGDKKLLSESLRMWGRFFFFNKQLSGFIISLKIFSRYLLLRKTPSKRFDRFWRHLWNMTILFMCLGWVVTLIWFKGFYQRFEWIPEFGKVGFLLD